MTGKGVKTIRERLGLNVHAFAAVLGVHVSTLYRWEGVKALAADPLQSELLAGLEQALKPLDLNAGRAFGDQISKALLGGGTLAALRVIIGAILKETP